MTPERWARIKEVFSAALEKSEDKRCDYLDGACGADALLREEVERLLAEQDAASLISPAVELLAQAAAPELAAGETLAHYRVEAKLGEGGMGAVYKAFDTRLHRSVALKVLPAGHLADPESKQRLVREARAASALNHPNIVTVHDIASDRGIDFIAMEYVDGQSLDRLIRGKALPRKSALDYAVQIAGALAKAHSAGIVHRDLKPANVVVTGDGRVKLLDFGLAKRVHLAEGETTTQTVEGAIVGTPGYMSPEQVEGKGADERSDIFAFGAMLYEMLSGRRAFAGDSIISILGAVLRAEPPPLAGVPPELSRLVTRCLRKDPTRRFQTMADLKVTLEELKEDSDPGKLAPGAPAPAKWRRWLWAAGFATIAALLVSAAVLLWRLREASPPSDLWPVALTSYLGAESQPSFSPDGNKVAFVWNGDQEDNPDIYIKQINSAGTPMRLTTSPSAEGSPAWSPDDRWIAFTRQQPQGNRAIMLVPPLGGQERMLTEMVGISGLSWTPDAKWLAFDAQESLKEPSSIWAISVETGERRRLTNFPNPTAKATEGGGLNDYSPSISPDGRALAFRRAVAIFVFEIYVLPLTRDLRPAGEPARVTDRRYATVYGLAWAADGHEIVYAAGGYRSNSLWRVPVSGGQTPRRLPYSLSAATYPAIARTPPRLMYTWWVFNSNLWRLDTRTGERKLLIGSTYESEIPQYSPDGRKIAFDSNRSGNAEVWTCDADGSNCQQLTSFGGPLCGAPRWSPDGRWLALDSRSEGQPEVYVIAADGGTPRRMTDHRANDFIPIWSRDGRWIYFSSDRSGRFEIWKMPAGGGQAVQVTRSGCAAALGSPDGKYIYCVKEFGPSGLFRMSVEGGEEKQVLPAVAKWESFGVTAKGVYFTPDTKTIQFLDTATGKVSTLATLDKPVTGGLSVSPDDAYVVWSQVDRDTQDLMLVENFR